VKVDAANGVGGGLLQEFSSAFFTYEVRNTTPQLLNEQCGAEHVQKTLTLPANFTDEPYLKCCSFDGDADRLVYFLAGDRKQVLDGSRLTVLYIAALKQLMARENVQAEVVVVSTGYMDGGSMRYITDTLGLPLHVEPTGVKYLHRKAKEFQICVYFEPNGHGTILVQPQLLETLAKAPYTLAFTTLANQSVGDAVTNLMLAEVSLYVLGWSLDTLAGLYRTQPGVTTKIEVPRKELLRVSYDETQIEEPSSLREEVVTVLASYQSSRALIRASGTEPCIRVFAEADTQTNAEALGEELKLVVLRHLS
jgi:phosphoacetylglucosamine mutase